MMVCVLLNEGAVSVHLHSIQMGLCQTQSRKSQQGPNKSTNSSQSQLHSQLGNRNSSGKKDQKLFDTV